MSRSVVQSAVVTRHPRASAVFPAGPMSVPLTAHAYRPVAPKTSSNAADHPSPLPPIAHP
eukprot:6667464-Pyramimonas_sp.AAC.1